jgi:hypothetical protein
MEAEDAAATCSGIDELPHPHLSVAGYGGQSYAQKSEVLKRKSGNEAMVVHPIRSKLPSSA